MKKFKIGLPLLALVLAFAASAFTTVQTLDSDLVWFPVNSSGQALNSMSGGRQGDNPPINCPGGLTYCATALSISQGEVVNNGDGTFGVASGVDITSSSTYEQRRNKN